MTSDALDPAAAGARRFAGKVCVVTGSGQGIGRATARRLAAEGGKIVVAERVAESAAETVAQLREHGAEALPAIVDVGNAQGARDLVEQAVRHFGRIDVLVNVVGGTIWWKPYHLYAAEEVDRELERSLYPTLWCCLAALPTMVEQRGGAIVNLSSSVARGELYRTPYAVAKGGVEALTRTLAAEYGRYGIRVNAVSPGATNVADRVTSRLVLGPGVVAEPAPDSEAYAREARADYERVALGRRAEPGEQAAAIAFLASGDAAYVTGQIVHCWGGPG